MEVPDTSPPSSRLLPLAGVTVVLLASVLAGCLGGAPASPSTGGQTLNESPTNETNRTEDLRNKSVIRPKNDTPTDPESSLHPHDYWDVGEEHVLIDTERTIDWSDYETECLPRDGLLCYHSPGFEVNVPIDAEDYTPNFVFPGTGRMNVTLEWSSSPSPEDQADHFRPGVCIVYTAVGGTWCEGPARGDIRTHWYSEPGTWTIEDEEHLGPDTWDPPHSIKSNWRFKVRACQPVTTGGPCVMPNVGISQFHLEVTIARGESDLPIDPPHFDYFQDRNSAALLEDWTIAEPQGAVPARHTASEWVGTLQDEERVMWYVGGSEISSAVEAGRSEIPVVGGGTNEMTVEVRWRNQFPIDLGLRYRTAADNWHEPWDVPSGDPTDCSDGEWSCRNYTIPVESIEQDSPYAHRTDWEWAVVFQSDEPVPLVDHEVRMDILIHRRGGSA